MYASTVKDQRLTFVVSGMLWNRSLVMMDLETKSLWSHVLGKAMAGPLKGTELEQIPSVMTDWQTWRQEHPEGTVALLSRTSRNYTREFYRELDNFVLGIVDEGKPLAWSLALLKQKPLLHDSLNKIPVVVMFDPDSVTARLYDRRLGEQTLTFRQKGESIVDQETGSSWDLVSGRAIAGPLKGKHLTALTAIISYRRAWQNFHPNSHIKTSRELQR